MPGLVTSATGSAGLPLPAGAIQHALIHPATPWLRSVPPAETGPAADPRAHRLFAAHPALGTLAEAERLALLQRSRVRTVRRKEIAGRQGDPASNVILVLEGYVMLTCQVGDGNEVFLDIAGPGTCIGEMLALHKAPQDATLTALAPCRLLLIDARHFRQAFERRPDGLRAILRLAGERLRQVTEHLVDSCGLTAPARLAKALLRLAQLSSPGTGGALPVRLSQGELGMMTGMCREVVNKQLRAWLADGLLDMAAGAVTSIRPTALADAVEAASREAEDRRAAG
jgi:CRP-like cAMP-binding protein